MYSPEQLIEQLNVHDWDDERRRQVVEEATFRIGRQLADDLTPEQYSEYESIVNDDQEVISSWLAANIPDYKESEVFQQILAGYESDPEKNNPEKLFATMAWVQLTVPNVQDKVAQTLEAYKQELQASL